MEALREERLRKLEALRRDRPRAGQRGAKYVGRRLGAQAAQPAKVEGAVPRANEQRKGSAQWAYGVTTYRPDGSGLYARERRRAQAPPYRRLDLLPRTLASLRNAGFANPILFVDGESDPSGWREEFKTEVVTRHPRIGAFGNWILALAELFIRRPHADYYAIFQDDIIAVRNLRQYIEAIQYPDRGYMNLYTFPRNQALSKGRVGFYPASDKQRGLGALGLVFSYEAALMVLSDPYTARRPKDRARGHKYIDGGVVELMNMNGWKEYVHNPSLLQHIGSMSTLGNPKHPTAPSFMGEGFDALKLLEVTDVPQIAPEEAQGAEAAQAG